MIWYSHLLKNFPQFVVIHTVKGFGIVNKTEVDVFLEISHFFDDPTDTCPTYFLYIHLESYQKAFFASAVNHDLEITHTNGCEPLVQASGKYVQPSR